MPLPTVSILTLSIGENKGQYQRGILLLRNLGYSDQHIEQIQGLVDAVLVDYDTMLRATLVRLAITTGALGHCSLNAAANGKARKIMNHNDEMIGNLLEFLARRQFERIPYREMTKKDANTRWANWTGPPEKPCEGSMD